MANPKGGAPKFYAFAVVTIGVAAAAVAYFHFARNQEISTVREARALVAERGPRIEVVTTTAGPTLRSIKPRFVERIPNREWRSFASGRSK